MNARHCIVGGLALVFLAVAALSIATGDRAKVTEDTTPTPGTTLMISASHPDGLDFVWSDASGYRGGYELIGDATGETVKSFGPGTTAGSARGLACGAAYRFWLVGGGRASNSVVGVTGPCEVTE